MAEITTRWIKKSTGVRGLLWDGGDPNGVLFCPKGSTCVDTLGPAVYINVDGGSTWEELGAGGGSGVGVLHFRLNSVEMQFIDTGPNGHAVLPQAGEITEVWLLADVSGSIQIDLWKTTFADFLTASSADSITGGNPIAVSSARKFSDNVLSGWTTSFSAKDILIVNVDSVSGSIDNGEVTLIIFTTLG